MKVIEVSLSASRQLNGVYRKKNQPTSVLSFHYGPDYGEILVCPEVIRQEAKKQGHSFKYQMTWMILHGMIHLAGIHHGDSRESARRVVQLETQVLKRLAGKNAKFKNQNSK